MSVSDKKNVQHPDWRLLPATVVIFCYSLTTAVLSSRILEIVFILQICAATSIFVLFIKSYLRGPENKVRSVQTLHLLLHLGLVLALSIPISVFQHQLHQQWEESDLGNVSRNNELVHVRFTLDQEVQERKNQFGSTIYSAPATITGLITSGSNETQKVEHPDLKWPIWISISEDLNFPSGMQLSARIRLSEASPLSRIQSYGQIKGPVASLDSEQHFTDPDMFAYIRDQLRAVARSHKTGLNFIDESRLGEQGRALIPSMIVGDVSDHDEQLREDMKVSGLSHLSAVSGANCALVFGAVTSFLRILRTHRSIQFLGSMTALVLFIMIVGPEPSVLRAGVMGLVGGLAIYTGRGRKSLPLLFVACLGLLVFDPWYATDLAFQLSVAATWGIIWWGSSLTVSLERFLPTFVAQTIAIAITAQFATLPVLGPAIGSLPTHSVLANVLVTPLLPGITLLGTSTLPMVTWLPELATVILYPVGLLTIAVGAVGEWAASLPLPLTPWPNGLTGYVLGFTLVGLFALVLRKTSQRLPSNTSTFKEKAMAKIKNYSSNSFVQKMVLTVVIGLIGLLSVRAFFPQSFHQDWDLALCDVGQGEMLVINLGGEKALVVDAGPDPALSDQCLEHLEVQVVEELFITHQHLDHYGGISGIFSNYPVNQVTYSTSENELYFQNDIPTSTLITQAKVSDHKQYAAPEHVKTVEVTILSAANHADEENNASLVMLVLFTEIGISLLVTGDMEVRAFSTYQNLLPDKIDILSVPHHGASNGGTELHELLDPSVALISAGQDNSYGHPHQQIVESLEKIEAQVLRTDELGSLWLKFGTDVIETGTF